MAYRLDKALLGKMAMLDDLPYVTGSTGLLGTRPSWDMMMDCDTFFMIGSTYQGVGLQYGAYKILVDEQDQIAGAHFLLDETTGVLNTFKQAMIDRKTVVEPHKNSIMPPPLHGKAISSLC